MIYRCVICMVETSQRSLMMLNGERRRLWETIISPLVNILELENSSLGTCSACFKLLNSMINFQQTMVAGANHILNLQAQLRSKHKPIIIRTAYNKLPPPMFSRSVADLVLPVVNEELVYSSESWQDVQFVVPAKASSIVKTRTLGLSGTVFHNIEPSAPVTVNLSETVVHGAVSIAGCNDDYAVLVPVKDTAINLLCEEEVSYSSESGKFEEAPPLAVCAKKDRKRVNVTETSEVRKQKLNRQLYEALRSTIQSPTIAKKFDNNYEPESVFELGHVKKNLWEHRSLYESENKLKDESCHNANVHMHKLSHETHEADESTNVFVHELRLDSGRMPRDESGHIWKDKLIHEIKHELGNISLRELEHEPSHVSRHNSNESVHKLSHESHKSTQDFGHELTHNSERISRDDSGHIWRDKLIHEIKHELGHISRHELENESNHVPGFKLKDGSCHNANESVHKLSHESHKSTQDFGHKLTHNSGRISRDDMGHIWRDKLIQEIKHELGPISCRELEHESSHVSRHKLKNGTCHNSNESVHKSSPESYKSTHDFGHELTHNSGCTSGDESGHIWKDKLIQEIKHELGPISCRESENESSNVSRHNLKNGTCRNSNESKHKLSHESHKSTQDFEHELTHNSGRISRDESGHIWRDKLIHDIKHKLGYISRHEWEHESNHVSKHKLKGESRHKLTYESTHKSVHESRHVPEHESRHVSGHELKDKSGQKSSYVSGYELKDDSGHKLKDGSGHESAYDSGHEMGCESRNDHDSSSTLSCGSDYENPELYPNIIFAQSFNKLSEDVKMHSHIVTNPPSEWPCTWERCQLQDSCSDEEVEEPAPNSGEVQNGGIREDSPETVFQCDVCREPCAGEAELELHKIKHRLQSAAPALHSCAACGVAFRSGYGLLRHRDTPKHAARALWRFQCDICKRKCPDKKQMEEHIERMHLAKDRMICPMCSAVLPSARSLGRHAATHILTPTETNTRTQTNETRKKRNIHEIRTETDANRLKKTYRRTNKKKLNKQKHLKTNMHKDTYLGSEDIIKSYQQVNKRKLNKQIKIKTNMHFDTRLDSEDFIKSYQQVNKRKLNKQPNLKTNMQIDTYVDVDVIKTYQQASKGKPKNGERDMYMNVLTYEQGNTDLYGDERNIYTILHPNGHDYTTKLPKTYTNRRKQTNEQTSNGRIKKRARKARTRKRARTRAPKAGPEPVLPVITNVVSLFDTLFD